MPRSSRSAATVEFVGPPRHLQLVSGRRIAEDAEFVAEGPLRPHVESFRLRRGRHASEPPRIRLRLSALAPPGDYEAIVRSKGASYKARVTVQRAPRLSFSPTELHFEAGPNQEVGETMVFVNRGNVAVRLPDHLVVGLFDDDGVETAFAATYRSDAKRLEAIAETFFAKLRDAHGGLLRMSVRADEMNIAPGAVVSASLTGRLPSNVKPGHAYHGVWSLDFVNIALTIAVTGERAS